ncbi:transcription factor S [Candidatus Bathyarchaeota archaeon]|nr:transcription factor S [Candidatus Bathyarchaeota archaeon]
MEFCPSCGTRLILREKEEEGTVLSCPNCGYEKPASSFTGSRKAMGHGPRDRIAVIGKEEQKLRTTPTAKIECPKCGNRLAYTWQVQTRSGDEGATQFFRCTNCGYTFREYT